MEFITEYAKCLKFAIDMSEISISSIDRDLIKNLYENEKTKPIISPLYHVLENRKDDIFFDEIVKIYATLDKAQL